MMVGQSASKKNGTKRQRNDTRTRKRFSFCLDVRSRSDRKLMETITALKKQRLFKRTIVDGIELICDLRAGRTTVLDRLFPHVREQLRREEAAKLSAAQSVTAPSLSEEFSQFMRDFAARAQQDQRRPTTNARQLAAGAYPFTRPPLVVETAAAKANFRETSATFAANLAGLFDEEEW